MSSESVCHVARSWVEVGRFHKRLVVRFMNFTASVLNILDTRSYVCTYVCMYVCIFVCLHVCMYVCMYVYRCVCTHACVYVCIYVCVCNKCSNSAKQHNYVTNINITKMSILIIKYV
jgi:hypothetical protein